MNDWMRLTILQFFFALAIIPTGLVNANETGALVLVANVDSKLGELSLRDVRKAYLGSRVGVNETVLVPLVNRIDDPLYEIFLQKVMFMSSQAYQRQLLRHFLQGKGQRPAEYRDKSDLLDHLSRNASAVTYIMWTEELNRLGLKVVTVLWNGES